jgi:hypothetical protein
MTEGTELLLRTENKQETETVTDFITSLNVDERKAFMHFLQGVRFAKQVKQSA